MTTGKTVFYFIKFCQREEWADDFIKGSLYLNRLSYFQNLEAHDDDDGRQDTNEALAMWFQPRNFHMTINNPIFGNIEITEKDLAAPTSISYNYHAHYHVLCLYAVYTSGFECVDAKWHLPESREGELRRQVRIDPRCFSFGRHAVVIAVRPFVERIKEVFRKEKRQFRAGLVHYYDDEAFNGKIPEDRIVFWKQKRFDYQREYRIAVAPRLLGSDPLIVNIGNISAFAVKVNSDNLNEVLQINKVA